jgi:hypothetical protein
VGLGIEHWVADKRLVGQALILDDAIVHAAFFAAVSPVFEHGRTGR